MLWDVPTNWTRFYPAEQVFQLAALVTRLPEGGALEAMAERAAEARELDLIQYEKEQEIATSCLICADAPISRRLTACGHGACVSCVAKLLDGARESTEVMVRFSALRAGVPAAAAAVPSTTCHAECPFCRVPVLAGATVTLPAGVLHADFDETAIVPAAAAAAAAARETAPKSAEIWRARRALSLMPQPGAGPTPSTFFVAQTVLIFNVFPNVLIGAVARGSQSIVSVLAALRSAAVAVRARGLSLSVMVTTARVCDAIRGISSVLETHVADAAVVSAATASGHSATT